MTPPRWKPTPFTRSATASSGSRPAHNRSTKQKTRYRGRNNGSSVRIEGCRSDPCHGRPDLHADARGHGRRGHQDRENPGGRRHPLHDSSQNRRRSGIVSDDEPQQEGHRAGPEEAWRRKSSAPPARLSRRAGGKLWPRRHGSARFRLRRNQQGQPGPDLLLAVRLWTHRPLQASPRLRSGGPSHERDHELYRRKARRTADQMWRAAVRHHRRHSRKLGPILAAYAHRLKTGQGQWVETSLFEAALVQTYWQAAIALATGVAPKAMGSAHPLNAPYQAFKASDKWIVVGGANQKHWLRTLEVLGASELARDRRFATGADRMAHLKELEALLAARFRTQPAAHWLGALEDVGVPCGPVNDMLQALTDPQTIARDMVVEVGHSSLGNVKTLGLPIKFSQTPGKVRTGAPLYGEHTAAILSAYGFDADEIATLQQEGAVATAAASVVPDEVR